MKAEDIKLKTSYSYKTFSGKIITVEPTKVFEDFEDLEFMDYSVSFEENNEAAALWGVDCYFQD